jgi:hypothetical protein
VRFVGFVEEGCEGTLPAGTLFMYVPIIIIIIIIIIIMEKVA